MKALYPSEYFNPNLPFSDFPIYIVIKGIAAWGHAAQVYLRKVFILQKRALRLMFFAGKRSHAIPLFVSANVSPLNMLYFETVCSLMHGISTNSAALNICDLFTCSSDVHTYNTRFSDAGNLFKQKTTSFYGL